MFIYSYCYVCSVLYIMSSSCQLAIFGLPWIMFFLAISSVVSQMPGYNSQRRGTAHTLPKLFVLFHVLFVCKCILYYYHRVSNQLQVQKLEVRRCCSEISFMIPQRITALARSIWFNVEFFPRISKKLPDVKFNENPSSGNRIIPCWGADGRKEKQTDMTRLTLRWLMSYKYGAPILDVSRSHTTTQHSR